MHNTLFADTINKKLTLQANLNLLMHRLLYSLAILLFTLPSFSQSKDFKWSVDVGAGAYGDFQDGFNGLISKLSLNRYISPTFDLTLANSLGMLNSESESFFDITSTSLNLRYKFYNNSILDDDVKYQPYFLAGPAISSHYERLLLGAHVGIGVKKKLTEKVSLFSEFNYIQTPSSTYYNDDPRNSSKISHSKRLNYWKASIGISIQFGSCPDDDGDGVCREKDRCPKTPKGVAVDHKGCPIDSDSDGIYDYQDLCPLDAGSVEFAGCPAPFSKPLIFEDSDFDGVFDVDDECPNEAGNIDSNGCQFVEEMEELEALVVYFDFDKYLLNEDEKEKLNYFLSKLELAPNYSITVIGNTDSYGRSDYNLKLSLIRAQIVKDYLVKNGLDESRIFPKGLGQIDSSMMSDSVNASQLNRRVTIELINIW